MKKLNKCPRCGKGGAILRDHYGSTMWDVTCNMCCWTDTFLEKIMAIEAWNTGVVNVLLPDYKKLEEKIRTADEARLHENVYYDAIIEKAHKALKKCRSVVSGYERPSEQHLKWLDEAIRESKQ